MSTSTRPTTRSGSETIDWTPGTPVRVCRSGVLCRYKGRTGWVAVVATQRFPDGRLYSEIGITWFLANDWAKATADAWFHTDELEARLL